MLLTRHTARTCKKKLMGLSPTSGITAMPIFQELCNSKQVAKQGTGYINARCDRPGRKGRLSCPDRYNYYYFS